MAEKTYDVTSIEEAKQRIPDIAVVGDGDAWQLLCKASSKSQGWMKSTKAMYIQGVGCLVQVSTQQFSTVAEAVTFVPEVKIATDANGGRKLVAMGIGDYPGENG